MRDHAESLHDRVDSARGDLDALRRVFLEEAERVGHGAASTAWWGLFGAEDASET